MRKTFLVILAVIAVMSAGFLVFASEDKPAAKVIAYYFYGTSRCPTCYKLEQYSKEAVETNFKDALVSGKLEFKSVNVEDKGNEHYGNNYQLYTKSLVLSLVKGGKETKWKNLEKIWEYVSNKQRFIDYVKSGVADFLKEAE
ncbi:MAG TPA: nitrophenyl compound nitroreductase subunit ArsF family protein [Candidatus Omnitrophota bacterium]|nr:nitrophenyl compound nitroreductase subunit ArsF family protein [Candidatus Omnitrophota bacterium]HPD84757.1 nitrophenyl compound nitroreductase subunit ArsF family protein [Candidatus Omnitrophota bacterium]HRZ03615.1 nitrophenyl compound nitroreductase subunit ArsF family protein [Candidatus Omnitrophota bacterium]